jgi:hypothetical protein
MAASPFSPMFPEPSTWATMILDFAGVGSWSIDGRAKVRWLSPQNQFASSAETAFGRSFVLAGFLRLVRLAPRSEARVFQSGAIYDEPALF